MSIPMVDLQQQYQQLRDELAPVVLQAMEKAQYINGQHVQTFEREAADYLGCQYAVGVNSGTDALHLALLAAGVNAGDDVIVPSFTFFASIGAILQTGARPLFVDIDADNFNLEVKQLEQVMTEHTKAIMPVHLYGQAANMDKVMAIAKQYNLKVIEDSAQSFGATWSGQQTGSIGDFGCFSFYPTKNLSCFGDGGLITTNTKANYEKLLSLRNHGMHRRYYHDEIGYNSRLDEIQAAILGVKLNYIDQFNDSRRQVAAYYSERLKDAVMIPVENPSAKHIYHQYTILHPKRDHIHSALQSKNIASMIYYPIPAHQQAAISDHYPGLSLPRTERISQQCLSLPIYPEMTLSQIDEVCAVIKQSLS